MTDHIDRHSPAFRKELKRHFGFFPEYRFLDLTLGDGGHTEEALLAGCQVVSVDVDPESIKRATNFLRNIATPVLIHDHLNCDYKRLSNQQWVIINTNFIYIKEAVDSLSIPLFDGVLVDLGPSQYQTLDHNRGFSFNSDSELDMRLDQKQQVKAKDLINMLNEGELRKLFELGDEPFAKPIARVIVSQRKVSPIVTCQQLANIITKIKHKKLSQIHPATQVFMALRMAVNLERENIASLMTVAPSLLKASGTLGVITFQSTEDKLVKECLGSLESQSIVSVINKKPITPSLEELKISKRTRSAKLRLVQKTKTI